MSSPSLRHSSRLALVRARPARPLRAFSTAAPWQEEEAQKRYPPPREETVPGTRREELELKSQGKWPVGSRRRRRAQYFTTQIPFEQLPYQCFQEARKVLKEDRDEKIQKIAKERARITNVKSRDASEFGGEAKKATKLYSMRKHLEELKIYADINDPIVKKTFEDGMGDLSKPIYRHYAEKKWREYKYKLLVQRITQMHIIPDLLPGLDPVADISIAFGKHNVQAGEFVDSEISEQAPQLTVQVFDGSERKVTVAVVDADVPNLETDGFDYQCHFLATNITLSPLQTSIALQSLDESQLVFPWLAPHAQKGAPYHRLAILVMQQREGEELDVSRMREQFQRRGFNPRAVVSNYHVKPMTATLFRTVWDDHTAAVMERAGLPGADMELKRKRGEALHWKYRVKDGERYR